MSEQAAAKCWACGRRPPKHGNRPERCVYCLADADSDPGIGWSRAARTQETLDRLDESRGELPAGDPWVGF